MRLLVLLTFIAACGGDDDSAGQQRPNPQPQTTQAAAPKIDDKNKLKQRTHVEDKIACPSPEKATGPACEPLNAGSGAGKMLPDCEPGLYCLPVGAAYNCEPCPERDTIRHEFKDRDFVSEQARDPFLSYVIVQAGVGQQTSSAKPEPHQTCKRADQFVATSYSYQDLRLVGIVAQGTTRKVLMMDTANVGHIIKRGDCVGKEKAVVKDIGTGYVTFVVEEDPDLKRPAQETSVQLHPGGLEPEPQSMPDVTVPTTTAPIVTPPRETKVSPSGASNVPVVTPGGAKVPVQLPKK
jgi:Tfp pilus assembly protein PilP